MALRETNLEAFKEDILKKNWVEKGLSKQRLLKGDELI
jgi:hypothetical protein